jgi:hypothetical protein
MANEETKDTTKTVVLKASLKGVIAIRHTLNNSGIRGETESDIHVDIEQILDRASPPNEMISGATIKLPEHLARFLQRKMREARENGIPGGINVGYREILEQLAVAGVK